MVLNLVVKKPVKKVVQVTYEAGRRAEYMDARNATRPIRGVALLAKTCNPSYALMHTHKISGTLHQNPALAPGVLT